MSGRGQVRFEDIVKMHGEFAALKGVTFDIEPGEFFALLGPSGSGKSTTLRILAGLDAPTSGRVFIDGHDITASDARDRDIAMVFQSYALYPHMTVYQNIAFPLEMAKLPRAEIGSAVKDAARKVAIDHLLDRKPGQLSGGQQQRCALARAIVRKACLFLLDEPLSNLDAKLRLETRTELKRLQRSLGVTAVYVTHDQEEAMAISDRIAIMNAGQIVQTGTAEDLYRRPASTFVATFLGEANLIRTTIVEMAMDRLTLGLGDSRWDVVTTSRGPLGAEVEAVVRPEAIRLSETKQGFSGRILSSTYLGSKIDYLVAIGDQTIKVVQSDPSAGPRFAEGATVEVALPHFGVQVLGAAMRH